MRITAISRIAGCDRCGALVYEPKAQSVACILLKEGRSSGVIEVHLCAAHPVEWDQYTTSSGEPRYYLKGQEIKALKGQRWSLEPEWEPRFSSR